jgi:hypothetical protein
MKMKTKLDINVYYYKNANIISPIEGIYLVTKNRHQGIV